MRKNTSLQKKLQEIFKHQSFEELETFKNTKTWKTLENSDRDLLASLFVMQGEKQLELDENTASESFDLALQVAPKNPQIYRDIGIALTCRKQDLASMKKAQDYLERSLQLEQDSFMGWYFLGRIHNQLGLILNDTPNFEEAVRCFEKAEEQGKTENHPDQGNLYWQWALSWYCQGKHSGEAVDFYKALDKFRKAASLGLQDKFFWSNYGDTYAELAMLLGRIDLFTEIVELYRNAVRQALDYFEGWLSLACAFHKLFEYFTSEDYYNQSYECFKMAAQINENHAVLWAKWAQLTAQSSKWKRDLNLLKESLEKFEKAHKIEAENPFVLCIWGETLLLYGAQVEDIEAIRAAEAKVLKSLEIEPTFHDAWYLLGCCLNEQGRYFAQEEFYFQAIEKFQTGIGHKQSEPLLWYGLGLSYFALGELHSEMKWLEQAVKLFSRVVEFGGQHMRTLWSDWGIALLKMGEITGDKDHVQAAIDKFEYLIPEKVEEWDQEDLDPEWLYNYGCALDFLGDFTEEIQCYERAVQALSKCIQLDPNYNHARYNLALALAHLGEVALDVECFHKSIEQFQILLNQDSEDEMGWNDYGLTIIHLAQLIYDPGHPEQSQKLYTIAESKLMQAASLGCTYAYYNLACLYALLNNHGMAIHFLEKADGAKALPSFDELLHDEWLDNLRDNEDFIAFLNDVRD